MTLLFFDGFDNGNTIPKPEWDKLRDWANATGRDGSTNGAVSHSGSTITQQVKTLTLPSAAATCIVGAGVMVNAGQMANTPSRDNYEFGFMVGGVVQCIVDINASGFIEVRRGANQPGTVLATSSAHAPITADTWNHIQIKYVAHTSNGTVEVKLNGATLISLTGANTATTSGSVSGIRCSAYQSCTIWYDDMWICDAVDATSTQNRPNNDYLGDLKVVTLIPDGAGDATFWSASTGSNYAAVDESPPNTTDYVSASGGVSGVRDLYTASNLPGLATEVYAMRGGLTATKTDIGQAWVKTVVKQDGVVAVSSGIFAPPVGGYSAFWDTLLVNRVSDGSGLTVTDINSMQIGIEVG